MNKLQILTKTGKNFFTPQELGVLWDYHEKNKLYELIKHYVRTGSLFAVARGVYALQEYQASEISSRVELLFEIANKLVPNSYVSLESVLFSQGSVTQYYAEVFSIARYATKREVLGIRFAYRKVKDEILLNDCGIVTHDGVRMASMERAVCDKLYLDPSAVMPEYGSFDKDVLMKVATIYNNQKLFRRIKKWIKENHA